VIRRRPPVRLLAGILLLALAAIGVPTVATTVAADADSSTVSLVVSFAKGTKPATQDAAAAQEGDIESSIPAVRARTIEVPAARAAMARKRLLGRSDVVAVEPDTTMTASLIPDDPYYGSGWSLPKVKLPAAWDTTTGASHILIAVVDTGLTRTDPDLPADKVVAGRNIIRSSTNTTDDNGHGTSATSVALMVGNNDAGGAGACWACQVMPVKVLGSNGSGSASNVAKGIVWAADNGADIISLSLGGGGLTALKNAVDYAVGKGITVLAAAGNDNRSTMQYPAAYPNAIAVGATDQNDNRTSYSNYGSWVDIAAPGTSIALNRTGSAVSFSGTSAATPLVAGIVGLMLSQNAGLSPASVRSILQTTADPTTIPLVAGSGRVDAAEAVGGITPGSSTTTTPTTTPTTTTAPTTTVAPTTTLAPTQTTQTNSGFTFTGTTSRSIAVKAGPVTFTATCSRGGNETLQILNSSGTVVASVSGTSPQTLSTTLAAGTYTFRVRSLSWSTVSTSITYLR
jgi:thermitase